MATFLDLSYELMYEILRLTMPEDLENFAQISKRVQEVAKPLLTDHRALIRKYRCYESWFNGNKTTSLLLQDVNATPHTGHYVREAVVDFDRYSRDHESYNEPEIEWLSSMVVESVYLAPDLNATAVRSLLTNSEPQCESAAFALLLPLLPNLEILRVENSWLFSKPWFTPLLSKAPGAANPFLTKLTRVFISHDRCRGYADVNFLKPYAALPSVRELSASDLYIAWREKDKHQPGLASGVTKLELQVNEYKADANGYSTFCTFLRDFHKLEVFKLSCVDQSTIEPSFIKEILLSTVKTSLRTLNILPDLGCQNFMGSLRDFEVLTDLHTNWPLLIKPGHNLQAVLPTSLHHLRLDDSKMHRANICKKVLQEILSGNDLGDLHLKHVTFGTQDIEVLGKPYQRLQKYCYERGLTLTFLHSGVTR